MSKPSIQTIGNLCNLPCFAFNKDKSKIAVSDLESGAYVYKKTGDKWTLECELTEHSSRITGIDWDHVSNRIATSGSDRNAHVWVEDDKKPGVWNPTLVILRIDRAATCIRWAPCGTKFAVGTGSKEVSVCYYDATSNWWACKKIKKGIKSTVLSVDWHPDSSVLAVASADFRTRVYYAHLDDIDKKATHNEWLDEKPTFGALLAEYNNSLGGWIHSVEFSPDGNKLAFTAHDSTLCVADRTISKDHLEVKRLKILPLTTVCWLDDSNLVGGGHDFKPYLFTYSGGKIEQKKCLDSNESGSQKSSASSGNAFSKFQNMDRFAQENLDSSVNSVHSNCIRTIRKLSKNSFISSGLDNQLVTWTI